MFCRSPLLQKNYRDAVKDHCHIKGEFRGAAHSNCNSKLRINPKTMAIPVLFHNLRGYDAHHLMQAMSQYKKDLICIANNMEKYITFTMGNLRFIDSLVLFLSSLDAVVKSTPKENLKITAAMGSELLFQKGIYPYEYIDSWERFEETCLPARSARVLQQFDGRAHNRGRERARKESLERMWLQNAGRPHDLYVETDAALSADVFENFRKLCHNRYAPGQRTITQRQGCLGMHSLKRQE